MVSKHSYMEYMGEYGYDNKKQQKINDKYNKNYKDWRVNRAKKQKMYLIEANKLEKSEKFFWQFNVQGNSGIYYWVNIQTDYFITCSCNDFQMRKQTCKHMYFIVARVALQPDLISQLKNKPKIEANILSKLDVQLQERLKSRLSNSKKPIELKEGISADSQLQCAICFDNLIKDDATKCLLGCKNIFHFSCMIEWLKRNTFCPLCRKTWKTKDQDDQDPEDPLGKIKPYNIDMKAKFDREDKIESYE